MTKLTIVITTSILVIIGFSVFFWNLAKKIQQPRRQIITKEPEYFYEDIEFPSNGGTIKGWFIPLNNKEASPLIILCHGWGSSRNTVYRYIDRLHQEGYALMLFDVRGHGESSDEKALTVKTFRDDILSAVEYAKSRKDVDQNRIGILGHSFGGFGSLLSLLKGNKVKVVVTDSSPIKFSTIMETYLKKKNLPTFPLVSILSKFIFLRAGIRAREIKEELNCKKAIEKTDVPILMTHSINDDFVPASELEYISSVAPVKSFYVKSKGHRSSQSDPDFWKNVVPFFNTYLSESVYHDKGISNE